MCSNMPKSFFATILFLLLTHALKAQNMHPYKNPDLSIQQRVDDLLARMTIEEKAGQLNQLNGGVLTGPQAATDPGQTGKLDLLRTGQVGSFLNVTGAEETGRVQKIAVEETRLGIPLLFGYDVIHGYKTIFPIPLAEACSWDLAAAEKAAAIAAKEASAAGIHWTFAPMMDLSREPRWGRVMEGSGEDPWLSGQFSAARVRGFQGKLDDQHVLATVKHFAAYGAPEGGREYNTVDMSRYALWNYYLPPYEAAVRAGAAAVMNSFNIFDGIPASGNRFLVTDILKTRWSFQGFVVSDWASFGEMITHGYAADTANAVEKALMAGSDMDMESRVFQQKLASLVRSGQLPEARLNDAVGRVLYWKFKLGLFDDPYRYHNPTREKAALLADQHQQAAREAAANSMVLLKNEGAILPLGKNLKSILVVGNLAESQDEVLDFWKGQGEHRHTVTILAGLKNKYPEATIEFVRGYDKTNTFIAGDATVIRQKARNADVVVAVIGLHGELAGEARALADINPAKGQLELLNVVKSTGKPLAVVVQAGRPMVLTDVVKNVPAILYAWIGGTQHGNAVADILSGDVNPSAKTVMSFPYAVGQIPVYYNHYNTGRPHRDGNEGPNDFWVSRYRDIPNAPLFPFGYGMSYSSFAYSDLAVAKNSINQNDTLRVSVSITNTSERDGIEIAQLYIRDVAASRVRPVKELKAFERRLIPAGATQRVAFELPAQQLGFFDENGNWLLEPGAFRVFVGPNSRDVQEAGFVLK
ncbi:MAG: beta-glucosidase BglX [Lewinellaceae bacterium]|nr:beta-glucosidase BglX [Lewinellaceae bacterium]